MKIHFRLHYRAQGEETLHAIIYRAGASANEQKINIPLVEVENNYWTGEIQLLLTQSLSLRYHYEVRRGVRVIRREWQTVPRGLELNPQIQNYFLNDSWRDLPRDSWAYSAALTRVWRKRKHEEQSLATFTRTLILRAHSARPDANERLWICGAGESLGNWNPEQAKPMQEIAPNEWAVALDADKLSFPFEYKFLIRPEHYKPEHSESSHWEEGDNRTFAAVSLTPGEVYIESDLRPIFSWENPLRVAGVEIPVFSLRSTSGWGCGDFGDLPHLVDWAVKTGQRVIQLLPVQDTTLTRSWRDSSPYHVLSAYALHPIYADMRALPPLPVAEEDNFEQMRLVLNEQPQVNYEGVLQLKLKRLKRAFEQEGKEQLASSEFRAFFEENEYWLPGYAMFCVLRDRFNTSEHGLWSQYVFFAREDARHFCALGAPDEQEVRFWYYVQFVLHTQLLRAAEYARGKGVVIAGDVPLGLSKDSVDVWMDPGFFRINAQAGAPPDDFSATGQNWGLPTYNWAAMARDGYRWWYRRMKHLSRYFDAYRLDHVQGFFRMWEVPHSADQGVLGQFVPAKGLDELEINQYGFHFLPEMTQPYISQAVLEDVFGVLAQHVTENYLRPVGSDRFELRPEYNSQRKIAEALKGNSPETALIRRGLCELAANVLFVKDISLPNVYHPRIGAQSTTVFSALAPDQQEAFKKLYEDYFAVRHEDLWRQTALHRLPAVLNSTTMLCCGEDLGVLPTCLPEVTGKLNILRLEIQRMPKTDEREFEDVSQYPHLSVAMPGTHDMSVLRAWWNENSKRTQHFWSKVLGKEGDAPSHANYEVCEAILKQHLESPAMIVLALFQDWMSIDMLLRGTDPEAERINEPSNPNNYWRYRMPIALEDLLDQTMLNEKIRMLISQSGR